MRHTDPIRAPHTAETEALARHWQVDLHTGLPLQEVEPRRQTHGPNRLPEGQAQPLWRRLIEPFADFMVLVLLAAAAVAVAMGEWTDAAVIVVIVVLNAVIGLVQSWKADQALLALRQLSVTHAQVRRDGHWHQVDADDLVPGDVVRLEAGAQVPADLRLHQVAQLRIDESALTGESVTVDKHTQPLPPGEHALGDRLNMAFRGTLVTHGAAEGLVVATGEHTQIGQVAGLLGSTQARATPLQRRLARFGKRMSGVVLAICALMFAIGVLRGEPPWVMALTAISLAVAAIPEALPAVVTVLLALGARRMVLGQALVRRLPAVETLGSVSTICSDKTGTLTLNRMQVRHTLEAAPELRDELWRAAQLCNDAQPVPDTPGRWLGDPTETALLQGAAEAGAPELQGVRLSFPRTHEWPFDADRKRMTTLHRLDHGGLTLTKGAPEQVLPHCVDIDLDAWSAQARELAQQGLRVLALAQRTWPQAQPQTPRHATSHEPLCPHGSPTGLDAGTVESGLQLLGLIALEDPPRPEARAAVAECLAAGITPVMITGDHPATAWAIARQLGIVPDDPGPPHRVLTGIELAGMDDAALSRAVADVRVYARVDPAQKIRIVQALQALGAFVAMTGDGVNDAPALKAADIGVAMGRGGTDVAREASALVLLDDHFATIVTAVREGRRIFDNIRKFVRYALTGNSGEIWTLFLAPLLGLPIPLLPLHILWINLVTDGLPGLALAAEPAEPGIMKRPPRPPQESLLAHGLWQHALLLGLLMAGLCLGLQAWTVHRGDPHGQTMVFTVLTLAQMAHILSIRSETVPIWRLAWRSNLPLTASVALTFALQMAVIYAPPLQALFHTQALTLPELGLCLAAAALVALASETEKAWRRRRVPARA